MVRDHLDDLTGLGPKKFQQLEECYLHANPDSNPLTLAEVLREREDGLLSLSRGVRKLISDPYVDWFLEDSLELLGAGDETAGYYNLKFNFCGREHGGAGGRGGVKPPVVFQQEFRDAMAGLRGNNIVTNMRQSEYRSSGQFANGNLVDELEDAGTEVLGSMGFSAQAFPDSSYIGYGSFDSGAMSDEEIGYLIASMLERHQVRYDWDGDDSLMIKVKTPTS